MGFILSDYAHEDLEIGGKGRNLALLQSNGVPVPTTAVFYDHEFCEDGIALNSDHASIIPTWAHNRLGPGPYAVRSSGLGEDGDEHSFAGIHESLLGVSNKALVDAMHKVYWSAFSDRALEYRKKAGLSLKPKMAVLIQLMIEVQYSFVCFTKHPSAATDRYLMQIHEGPCDDIVSGKETGEVIGLSKTDQSLYQLFAQRGLNFVEWSGAVTRCQHALGDKGVDIEGGWTKEGKLYIFQARKVTI